MSETAIQRRFRRIYDIGCLCCRKRGWGITPCQVQHLNLDSHAGQLKLGDEHTIGLCPWHHQGQPVRGMSEKQCARILGPSMAHESVRFREVFGTDAELLAEQNRLIEEWEQCVVGVKRA